MGHTGLREAQLERDSRLYRAGAIGELLLQHLLQKNLSHLAGGLETIPDSLDGEYFID